MPKENNILKPIKGIRDFTFKILTEFFTALIHCTQLVTFTCSFCGNRCFFPQISKENTSYVAVCSESAKPCVVVPFNLPNVRVWFGCFITKSDKLCFIDSLLEDLHSITQHVWGRGLTRRTQPIRKHPRFQGVPLWREQKLNSTREGGSESVPLLMGGGVIITNIHMCEAVW